MQNKSRRDFLGKTAALGSLVYFTPNWRNAMPPLATDPIDPKIVKEFVGVAHNNLDRVKEIAAEYPHIINAAWDWGDGDFEMAIGAAGHMGHREYAEFLLANGARADIFVLAMLGETDIVKATIERYPNLLFSLGPHGFTLLHHAKQGGEKAKELFDYFSEKGLKEMHVKIYKR